MQRQGGRWALLWPMHRGPTVWVTSSPQTEPTQLGSRRSLGPTDTVPWPSGEHPVQVEVLPPAQQRQAAQARLHARARPGRNSSRTQAQAHSPKDKCELKQGQRRQAPRPGVRLGDWPKKKGQAEVKAMTEAGARVRPGRGWRRCGRQGAEGGSGSRRRWPSPVAAAGPGGREKVVGDGTVSTLLCAKHAMGVTQ